MSIAEKKPLLVAFKVSETEHKEIKKIAKKNNATISSVLRHGLNLLITNPK